MKTTYRSLLPAILLIPSFLFSQNIRHQVFMFGNFTDVENKTAFTAQLEKELNQSEQPFTLILNGDLVDVKIDDYDHQDKIEPVLRLIDLVEKNKNGQIIILPGDRDWNSSKRGGEKSQNNLEKRIKAYIKNNNYERSFWAVKDGCPGPNVFEVDKSLAIITLNTQWWNHPFDKPRPSDAKCEGLSEENLKEELEDAVEDYRDRNVLIVGHHPFFSAGNYGGVFSFGDHFKPLPILGLFNTSFHANAGNSFDLSNEHLHPFIFTMKNLFYFQENIIYASAHEKNQQILEGSDNYIINSGAPDKSKFAGKRKQTVYSEKKAGIMRLDYFGDGQVDAVFLENLSGKKNQSQNTLAENDRYTLFHSACSEEPVEGDVLFNTSFAPCMAGARATRNMTFNYAIKAKTKGGPGYLAGAGKRFWFGKHYRTTWDKEVTVPYLDLDNTHEGLTIYKKGGGRQTTSLKFKAGNGSVYTFRSVDKDPTKALDYRLKNTIAAPVVQDFTSTQHPYGAMAVAPLLDEINILHATPTLYVLPDDAKLGPFRKKYGNLFGMLEENPGKKNKEGKHFADAEDIEKSVDMFQRFYKNQNAELQLDEFVRARLFDIWVGDWSKHEDNWKWARYKTDKGHLYRPIPRDRDHVFSRQDGLINWLADRRFGMQNIENFGHDFSDIRSLTYQARNMDRYLMQEATRDLFLEQAKYIQDHISEKDIEEAIKKMPPEIIELSGKEIEEKLKNRIKYLDQAAGTYYALLNKEVDVTGTKDEEYFEINYADDGTVDVQIFNMENGKKGDKKLYGRKFFPNETKEVRVWGLANGDIFHITGNNKKSKIKVRAFGGPGGDVFENEAATKTLLYDKGVGTKFNTGKSAKVVKYWNRELYEYDRLRFDYNYFLPLISLGYTNYTGFTYGLSGNWTLRNFTKDEYQSKHKIYVGYTTEQNLSIGYLGRFHQAVREWDLLLDAHLADPQLQNRFYGIGNSTINLDDDLGVDFYRSAVKTEHFSTGLAREFWQQSSIQITAGIERNESQNIDGTFLSENLNDPNIYGANQQWTMIPLGVNIDLDFRDERGLPYHGARAVLNAQNISVVDGATSNFSYRILTGHLEYYMSTRNRHPFTLGLRAGGATTDGAVPWYHLPTLGTDNGLRGYIEQRWTGDENVYFNSELRYEVARARTSLVPVKIGVKVFYDYGRVFSDVEDESTDWRSGYGFGLYVVPLTESLTISLSLGFSDEESVYPVFSVGTPLR